jgi:hypothetical protein
MKHRIARVAMVMAAFAIAVVGFQAVQQIDIQSNTAIAAPAEKVEVCHATGSDSNPFVVIQTKALGELGAWGHLDENGNPESGHEEDFLAVDGQCNKKYCH